VVRVKLWLLRLPSTRPCSCDIHDAFLSDFLEKELTNLLRFSEAYPTAHFIKLDIDDVPEVAAELGIRSIPTFFIYKKGEKLSQILGTNMAGLKTAIESAVKEENTLVTDEDF
jgi:thioredoxin-like negative regulator of GroEL